MREHLSHRPSVSDAFLARNNADTGTTAPPSASELPSGAKSATRWNLEELMALERTGPSRRMPRCRIRDPLLNHANRLLTNLLLLLLLRRALQSSARSHAEVVTPGATATSPENPPPCREPRGIDSLLLAIKQLLFDNKSVSLLSGMSNGRINSRGIAASRRPRGVLHLR